MSNTIDDRVVVLSFDNKDFETNAQQTLATLDKLDKGLKLDNANKSLSGLMVSSKSLGLTDISSNLDALSKRFSTLGIIGMTALSRITNAAITAGASIVKGVINPIVEGGKRRAMNVEQADFMLHGLMDDEEKIASIMKSAKDSVTDTAYSYDVATKAAAQFAAAGVETGEKLDTVLKAVTGTAATFNADYAGIADIFTKIASSGRVMGEEFNQLTARGVPAVETLVDYINKVNEGEDIASESLKQYIQDITGGMKIAGDAITEFRKDGLINFELFSSAMAYAFGDHAKAANDTVTGVFNNIQAALARTGEMFYAPLIKQKGPLVQFLMAVKSKINEFNTVLAPFATAVASAANKILSWSTTIVKQIKLSWIGEITGKLTDAINKFFKFGESVEKAVKKPVEEIKKLEEAVKSITPEEAQAAWDIWLKGSYGNGEARKKALEEAGLSYENVQGYVNELIEAEFDLSKVQTQVADGGSKGAEKVATAQEKVNKAIERQKKELSPAYKLWMSLKYTLGGIANIGRGIADAFKKVASNFKMPAIAADGLVDKIFDLSSRFYMLTARFKLSDKAAKKIADTIKKVGSIIKTVVTTIVNIVKTIGPPIINVFTTVFSTLKSGIANVVEFVKNLKSAADGSERFQKVLKIFKNVAKGVVNAFKDIVSHFGEFIDKLKASDGFAKFKEQFEGAGNSIKDKVLPYLDKLIDGLSKLTNGGNFNLPSVETAVNFFSGIFEKLAGFIEKIKKGKDVVVDFIKNLKIGSSGAGSPVAAFMGGSADGDNLLNTIKQQYDKIKKQLEDYFKDFDLEKAGELFKKAFGKLSEKLKDVDWNKVADATIGIARVVILFKSIKELKKLADGVVNALQSIGQAAQGIAGSLQELVGAFKFKFRMEGLKSFAVAVGIIAASVAVLALVDSKYDIYNATKTVEELLMCMVGVALILRQFGGDFKDLAGIGIAFGGMGAGILMMASAMKSIAELNSIDPAGLDMAMQAIISLMAVMSIAAHFAKGGGGIGIAAMAASIMLLVPAILTFSRMKWDTFGQGAGKVAILMGALVLISQQAKKAAGGAGVILALALAVDMLTIPLMALSLIPTDKLAGAALAVSLVIAVLAGSAQAASEAAAGAKNILAMVIPIAAACIGLAVLASYPWPNILVAAISLSGVMLAAGGAAKLATGAVSGAMSMLLVIGVTAAALGILANMDNPNVVLPIAEGMALVIGSCAIAIKLLGNSDWLAGAKAAANLVEFLGILGGAIAGIGILLNEFDKGNVTEAALTRMQTVLELFGGAIGSFVGGIAEGVTNSLPQIGENLNGFAENAGSFITAFKDFDPAPIKGLAGALAALTGESLLDSLANLGGKSSLTKIGQQLKDFGQPMLEFSQIVAQIPEDTPTKAGAAIGAAKTVSEKGKDIKDFKPGKFIDGLVQFGQAFYRYSISIAKVNTEGVTGATGALRQTIGIIKTVNQNGGDSAALVNFGLNIYDFAQDYARFSESAAKVNAGGVEGLIKSAKEMLAFAKSAEGVNTAGLSSISASMGSFVSGFSASMASAGSINMGNLSGLQSQMTQLQGIVKQAQGLDASSITRFVTAFNQAGQKGINGFIQAMTGGAVKARAAAASVVSAAGAGLSSTSAFVSATAYSVGNNIGQGVIRGLNSVLSSVRAKAAEIGRLAAQATKQGAQINSPSKISMETGEGIGEGIVVGLNRMTNTVIKSGAGMGKDAADSVSSALNRMKDIIEGDYGDLTITPVLDLSEVESRASQLSGIFGDQTVELSGYANSAAASMAAMRSNEDTNSKLISAIKGLKSNSQNNTFNITVDGAENPEDFADRLVRRMKIRSRM